MALATWRRLTIFHVVPVPASEERRCTKRAAWGLRRAWRTDAIRRVAFCRLSVR